MLGERFCGFVTRKDKKDLHSKIKRIKLNRERKTSGSVQAGLCNTVVVYAETSGEPKGGRSHKGTLLIKRVREIKRRLSE